MPGLRRVSGWTRLERSGTSLRGPGGRGPQRPFELDEAAFELHVVAGLHIEPRQAGVAAHGALLADGDIGIIDDGEEGPLGVGMALALGGFYERFLGIERHGDGRAAVKLVGDFFEFGVGDWHIVILGWGRVRG